MKRKRFSVEQIVAAVKQHDLGVSATDTALNRFLAIPRLLLQSRGMPIDQRVSLESSRSIQSRPFPSSVGA